jgi:hypothetical protein
MTFELVDGFEFIRRRDWGVEASAADAAGHEPLNPLDARPYIIGEWLQLNANYNMQRGGNNAGNLTDEALVPSWPVYMERGRTDTQAIAAGRDANGNILTGQTTVLWNHAFEARTDVCDSTGMAVGSALAVFDIVEAVTLIVRRGLGPAVAGTPIVGYVTRIHDTNDIRFWRTLG